MFSFFFFNDTATTEIYTLSLHDALPIFPCTRWISISLIWEELIQRDRAEPFPLYNNRGKGSARSLWMSSSQINRSEEHTSELQSLAYLVCRLLLEKKKI